MEKKVRVKRLNHQDDVKRSWSAVYPLTEDIEEDMLPKDWERAQAKLEPAKNDFSQALPSDGQCSDGQCSDGQYNDDHGAK